MIQFVTIFCCLTDRASYEMRINDYSQRKEVCKWEFAF